MLVLKLKINPSVSHKFLYETCSVNKSRNFIDLQPVFSFIVDFLATAAVFFGTTVHQQHLVVLAILLLRSVESHNGARGNILAGPL